MGAVVSDGERARFAQRPTANTAAYQLYLKGRALKTYDAGSQRAAATLFEQVVALDSGFADAWSALSIAMSLLYSAGTPGAELRAREALDRAVALDPTSLQAHLAGAQYQVLVARNPLHARAEFDLALRAAPTDDEVLSSAAQADMMLGDYGSALAKYERAREIDPRSFVTLVGLARVYSRVGRLADAEHALTTALLARPGDLTVIRELAQWRVAQGKLAEARAGIRGVIDSGVPATDVVADFAGYEEAGWILDDPEQQLVLRLRPTAFDNYRDWWGQSLAIMHLQRGDTVLARAYADSALVAATHVDTVPGERTQSINALMLALTGKRKQAEAVEELALQLLPGSPARTSYDILMAVRVELVLGDQERVLDLLEESRRRGGYLTPDWLALDPTFRGLKGNPRFEKLLEK
jgi:Tfp pilus assembly protein PilF